MTRPLPVAEAELHAYVDGQLAPERRHAVEQWLASHPQDASRTAAYRLLAEQWRAAYAYLLAEPVPESMLAVVRGPDVRRRRFMRVAAAIAAGAIIGAVGIGQLFSPGVPAVEMLQRAAVAHAVFAAETRHPVEADSGHAELLAWLSGRLQMKVEAPDLRAAGLSFIGGRLLPGERAPAAQLMYEGRNGRRVTLYWAPEFRNEHETELRYGGAERGTRLYYWIDEECGYAVASADLARKELQVVAAMAYAQLEK
jgi:anti-sigma factor RsiW